MHIIKQIAVSVAALAATTSLVCGDGQQASESSRSKAIAGVGQVQRTPILPTSVGPSAQQSPGDPSLPHTVTQIDVPGATSTSASRINAGGDIVGSFSDSSGTHGFLLSDGAFTTIDFPGATSTFTGGINRQGEIVGSYIDSSSHSHGYLLSNGAFTPIDVPGSDLTFAADINSRGDIVGTYGANSGIHGFLLSALNFDPNPIYTAHGDFINMDLTFTTPSLTAGQNYVLTVTADEGSSFDAIVTIKDPNGNIVVNAQDTGADETIYFSAEVTGQYTIIVMSFGGTMGPFTVNVYNGVTTIDAPGSTFTEPLGINSRGDIVGFYYDSSFIAHGFLLSNGSFTTIDAPGGQTFTSTFLSDISQQGDIVGYAVNKGIKDHAFLLRNGEFIPINIPGADSATASGINALGIVGSFTDSSGITHGYLLSR